MKKLAYLTGVAMLLFVVSGAAAFAAPDAVSRPAALGPLTLLDRLERSQQSVVDQLEAARLQQVKALVRAGRPAEVEFAGALQTAAGGTWSVAGLRLTQSTRTVFDGAPAAGLHAHVRAQIHSDGSLEALHVHTLAHDEQTAASPHLSHWLHDDHGVHFGGCQEASSGNHAAEHTGEHPAAHHPETPAQQPAQPAHHEEHSHGGGHGSGHDGGHH